jgi:predicted aldo/keto reductase-like oxidoreductase
MTSDRYTELDRRAFIKGATAAALGAGLLAEELGAVPVEDKETSAAPGDLPRRILGRTGLEVTPVSFGGIQIQQERLLDVAIDSGIQLIHTSPGYGGGRSIDLFGKVMKRRRQEVILALKASPVGGIDQHLKTLNTDSVDILVPPLHDVEAMKNPELPGAYAKLKEEGKIRFSGYACHNNIADVMNLSIDLGYFDVLLIAYHLANREELDPILERAKKQGNLGFMAMKAARKIEADDMPAAFSSLLQNPRVDTLLIGMSNLAEVKVNAAITGERMGLMDRLRVREYATLAATGCAMCGSCDVCPQGVAISDIRRCGLYLGSGETELARTTYAGLPRSLAACDDCGQCQRACPRSRPVLDELRAIHQALA